MGELSHVLWIGGPAASGKTTVARLLARRHGLRWYCVDAHAWQFRDRAVAAGVVLPPDGGPGEFDRGPMIREDLRSLSWPLVVVEGALVTPDLAGTSRAVWLMPSREEQQARLEKRHPAGVHHGYVWGWELIRGQLDAAPAAGTIVVDGQSVGETLAAVEHRFAEHVAAGPVARRRSDRQRLLRYANEVAVTHSLTAFARQSTPPDPATVIRTFDCECAAPTCDAFVDVPLSDAAAALTGPPPALVAPGHHALDQSAV